MQTRSADFIYKNDLDKTCFQHDMAYGNYKDLNRRTQSDKVLKVKMQVNQNMMVIKQDQFQCYASVMSNEQLAKELHKPSIRKFKRQRVYSSFKYNIWGVDLADMQLIRKYKKRVRYLL